MDLECPVDEGLSQFGPNGLHTLVLGGRLNARSPDDQRFTGGVSNRQGDPDDIAVPGDQCIDAGARRGVDAVAAGGGHEVGRGLP